MIEINGLLGDLGELLLVVRLILIVRTALANGLTTRQYWATEFTVPIQWILDIITQEIGDHITFPFDLNLTTTTGK